MQTAPFAGFVNKYVPQPAAPRGGDYLGRDRSHTVTSTPISTPINTPINTPISISTPLPAQPSVLQQSSKESNKQKARSIMSSDASQSMHVAAATKLGNARPVSKSSQRGASANLPQTYDTSVSSSLVAGMLGAAALLLLCVKRTIRCEA